MKVLAVYSIKGGVGKTAAAVNLAHAAAGEGLRTLLVDTSRRPRPRARRLAAEMGGEYVPLPFADAAAISASVQRSVA